MSEIRYSKDNYDTKMGYLSMMTGRIDYISDYEFTSGSNVSETIDELLSLYDRIKTIMRYYKWSMEDTLQSLQNAGDAIFQADQNSKDL